MRKRKSEPERQDQRQPRETSRWQMLASFAVGCVILVVSMVMAFLEVDPPEGFYWFASAFVATFTANYAVRKTASERLFAPGRGGYEKANF